MGCGGSKDAAVPAASGENPKVFFDISVGGVPKGRIVMQLRADVVPKTAEVSIASRSQKMFRDGGLL